MDRITLLNLIEQDKTWQTYGYHDHWISGSSTIVYPIACWQNDITIQWTKCRRDIIERFINRIICKSDGILKSGVFVKSDGSCPNYIVLYFQTKSF